MHLPILGLKKENLPSKISYRFSTDWREPTSVIGIVLTIVFAYLILAPILSLLYDAIQVQFGDQRRAGSPVGGLTSYYLNRTLFSPVSSDLFWEPLSHTLSISIGTILISLSVGCILAWLLGRTNLFGRRWFATALIVPYMLPSWTFALAWRTAFKNREVGGQMGWFEALGLTPPDWLAYGQFPITIILALHYTPFVILLFGNALRRLDSQLEESARILGASPQVVARKIILPLMLPSLMSATVLIFAKCLGEFGVSYVLGLPVDYDVLYTFWQDVDERADCDFRGGNCDPHEEADLYNGGKYFDQIANKLKAHLDANKPPIKLTPIDTTTHRKTTKMDFIKANKEAQQ